MQIIKNFNDFCEKTNYKIGLMLQNIEDIIYC